MAALLSPCCAPSKEPPTVGEGDPFHILLHTPPQGSQQMLPAMEGRSLAPCLALSATVKAGWEGRGQRLQEL